MPIDGLTKEEARAEMRAAIKEWMAEQFQIVGKWTVGGLMAGAFGGIVYLALTGAGWHRP